MSIPQAVPHANPLGFAWSVAMRVASPGLRLALRARARRGKEISIRLPERRAIETVPRPAGRLVWLHAASVGETVSVLPVITALDKLAPDTHVLVTTGTVTSANLLAERLFALRLQFHVSHRFIPLDVPQWVARFLDHWRPDVAGFVESELWPNFLAGCQANAIPLLLINARLSPRSFSRWRRVPGLARAMLDTVSEVQAQSMADAARFVTLGARSVIVAGNLKFAAPVLPVDEPELAQCRAVLAGRPTWLAASTHPGEEALILAAHQILARNHPRLLTVIVPRHPERGAQIAAQLNSVTTRRRGAGEGPPPEDGVWIGDTLGELGLFYRLAPIVLMGNSLMRPGGGHNPLEPARLGCAVATGPHMTNFADIAATLEEAGALARVADTAAVTAWVDGLLRDPARRTAMGDKAQAACELSDDMPARIATRLLAMIPAGTA